MLVLTREIGQSVIIEDVRVTVIRFGSDFAELSFAKITGGEAKIVTMSRNESVDACYDVRITFVQGTRAKLRLGFEAPREVHIHRED